MYRETISWQYREIVIVITVVKSILSLFHSQDTDFLSTNLYKMYIACVIYNELLEPFDDIFPVWTCIPRNVLVQWFEE